MHFSREMASISSVQLVLVYFLFQFVITTVQFFKIRTMNYLFFFILLPLAIAKRSNGSWRKWSEFSSCYTSNCNIKPLMGFQFRTRICDNPRPSGGGSMCQGRHLDAGLCFDPINCPVDGMWSQWSEWNCVGNSMLRVRKCDNPAPKNGGKECDLKESVETVDEEEDEESFREICRKKIKNKLPSDDEDLINSGSGSGSGSGGEL